MLLALAIDTHNFSTKNQARMIHVCTTCAPWTVNIYQYHFIHICRVESHEQPRATETCCFRVPTKALDAEPPSCNEGTCRQTHNGTNTLPRFNCLVPITSVRAPPTSIGALALYHRHLCNHLYSHAFLVLTHCNSSHCTRQHVRDSVSGRHGPDRTSSRREEHS